jgi:biotin carboxyl carrier protein
MSEIKPTLVKVDAFTFPFSGEELETADISRLSADTYHVIAGHRSVIARVVEEDVSGKKMTIEVDGQRFDVHIQEELDMLLEKMGFGKSATRKVKEVKAPMPGLVLVINAELGQELKEGDKLLVLEAMKMENSILMPGDGKVKAIRVKPGQPVDKGQILIELE